MMVVVFFVVDLRVDGERDVDAINFKFLSTKNIWFQIPESLLKTKTTTRKS